MKKLKLPEGKLVVIANIPFEAMGSSENHIVCAIKTEETVKTDPDYPDYGFNYDNSDFYYDLLDKVLPSSCEEMEGIFTISKEEYEQLKLNINDAIIFYEFSDYKKLYPNFMINW